MTQDGMCLFVEEQLLFSVRDGFARDSRAASSDVISNALNG